jgi:CheY-like chemotaxis protein
VPEQPKRTVFIVDDEPVIATTLAAILKNHGFSARAFTNPKDALESADSEHPDLLITDVMMPEMNGIELGIQFRTRFPMCKVMLFSGHADTVSLLAGAREDEDGSNFTVLAKPIHPKDLLAAISGITA